MDDPSDTNPDHLDRLIHENEAADLLSYSPRALQNWRLRGGGPPFIRVSSRSIRYSRRDLQGWIDSKRRQSTSDFGGSDHD